FSPVSVTVARRSGALVVSARTTRPRMRAVPMVGAAGVTVVRSRGGVEGRGVCVPGVTTWPARGTATATTLNSAHTTVVRTPRDRVDEDGLARPSFSEGGPRLGTITAAAPDSVPAFVLHPE